MSGLPEQRRQVLNFLSLNTAGTPFDREILERDIRVWFQEVNQRHAQGEAKARNLDAQLNRALQEERAELKTEIAVLQDPTHSSAANSAASLEALQARCAVLDGLLEKESNLANFKSSLPAHTADGVKDFVAYGVREGLYASVANSTVYVGNISREGHVIPFGQKPGGAGIIERYQAHATDPHSFEYQLTFPCVNTYFAVKDSHDNVDMRNRPDPNELVVKYRIKVTLPEDYDFKDASIDRIQYSVEQYELTYTDHHSEELLFSKRSEPDAEGEIARRNPDFDPKFFRFTTGGALPDPRLLEQAESLKAACDTPIFLGFFHQAMVYQRPNEKLVFVAQPFEIDQQVGSRGDSDNLKAILDFCKANQVEAEIIASVAEKSYPLVVQPKASIFKKVLSVFLHALTIREPVRQHFVTHHYKLDAIGAGNVNASGFDERSMLIQGNCYDPMKEHPFASDTQEKLLEELGLDSAQVTRHYVGVQTNDIDCGYWSTVTAEALLHRGSADLRAHLAKPLTEENMQACKAFALQEKPYNNAIMNLAATLTRATEDEAVESVSPSTSTAGLKDSPSSGVGTGSEPEEDVDPQMDDGVQGASSSQSEDDEEPELIALSAGDAEKAKQIRTDDRATCLVVLGLLSNDLLPASVASVAEDWRLKQDDLLKEPAARLAMTTARYAAIAAEAKVAAAQAAPELVGPSKLQVAADAAEAARQATLQRLALQLEAQQAEEALRAAAQRQQEEEREQAEVQVREQAEREATLHSAHAAAVARATEQRTRATTMSMLSAIVVDQRKRAYSTGNLPNLFQRTMDSPAPAPSIGVSPPRPVTPPQPVVPPAKKPTWFAGWEKRHFAAALGLAFLALTIILIPLAIVLWRKVLKPSIAKNLAKQTAAQQPVVATANTSDQDPMLVLAAPVALIAPASGTVVRKLLVRSYSQGDLRLQESQSPKP